MSDADLLRAIAALDGLTLPVVTLPPLAAQADTRALLHELAARSGATLSEDDIEPFLALDPRVLGPVTTLLVATTMAWDLRERALASMTPEEQMELILLGRDGAPVDRERFTALGAHVEREYIFAAAILLLDTTESLVVPELKEAFRMGAWPAGAAADPVGILRLGSLGNDVETIDRMLQIDPSGNDVYRNNAGATNFNDIAIRPPHPYFPISMSLDFEGDDDYIGRGSVGFDLNFMEGQGAANVPGIGILVDYQGNDEYRCARFCQGTGAFFGAIGYHRDAAGNDYLGGRGLASIGYSDTNGVGVHRNDEGDDEYHTATGGGVAVDVFTIDQGIETGVLWDGGGKDYYENYDSVDAFGISFGWGRGWLVDDGSEIDRYDTMSLPGPLRHGCNDCDWRVGNRPNPLASGPGGRGVDNGGGLPWLLAQDP